MSRKDRGSAGSSSCSSIDGSLSSRRKYASLDVGSMGVDVNKGPLTSLDNKMLDENFEWVTFYEFKSYAFFNVSRGFSSNLRSCGPSKELSSENLNEEFESEKLVESITEKIVKEIDKNVVMRRRQKARSVRMTLPPGLLNSSNSKLFKRKPRAY